MKRNAAFNAATRKRKKKKKRLKVLTCCSVEGVNVARFSTTVKM